KNLAAGRGYVGFWNVPDLAFPPFYPTLIAVSSRLAGNFDVAARLVSIIIGTCLILPVYLITLRIYGSRAAVISASLITLHPLLIVLSGSAYSEVAFLTLLMTGVYFGMESLQLGNAKNSILCGVSLGFAYLTRPEAIALPVLVSTAIILVALFDKQEVK